MTCFYYCTGLTSFQWRTMKLACHEQKALSVYYPPFCVVFASDWTSLKAIDYSLAKGKLRHVVRSLCVSKNNVFEEHTSPVSYQETHFTSKLSLCDLRTHFTILSSLLRDLGGERSFQETAVNGVTSQVQCVKRTDSRLPKRRLLAQKEARFEQKDRGRGPLFRGNPYYLVRLRHTINIRLCPLFIRDSHSFVFVAALAHNLLTSSSFLNKIVETRSFVTNTQIRHIQNHSPSRFIWLLQSSNSRLLGSLKQ